MTLTIARASFPDDGGDRDALLRAADRRLHAVKDERGAPSRRGWAPVVAPVGTA